MILLGSNQITQGDKVEFITAWEVKFQTPGGLADSLEEANKFCETYGFDSFVIKPMVVAVGATLRELCL